MDSTYPVCDDNIITHGFSLLVHWELSLYMSWQVRLDALFWSKPCSLALPPNSTLRIEEPQYEGIRRFMLKLMLFYSKQSKSIRGANVVYRRIISQVDKPAIYDGAFSFLWPINLILHNYSGLQMVFSWAIFLKNYHHASFC